MKSWLKPGTAQKAPILTPRTSLEVIFNPSRTCMFVPSVLRKLPFGKKKDKDRQPSETENIWPPGWLDGEENLSQCMEKVHNLYQICVDTFALTKRALTRRMVTFSYFYKGHNYGSNTRSKV